MQVSFWRLMGLRLQAYRDLSNAQYMQRRLSGHAAPAVTQSHCGTPGNAMSAPRSSLCMDAVPYKACSAHAGHVQGQRQEGVACSCSIVHQRHCTWASLSKFCMEAVPRKDKTMREAAWDLALHPTSTCNVHEC